MTTTVWQHDMIWATRNSHYTGDIMIPSSDVFIEYLLVLDIHSNAFMPILSFFDVKAIWESDNLFWLDQISFADAIFML